MIQITPYYSKSVHIFGSIFHTEKPIHTIIHMLDVVKEARMCVLTQDMKGK